MSTSATNKAESKQEKEVKQVKEGFVTRFNEIIDGAERLLKETADHADEKTSDLRDQLSSKISDMRSSMDEHMQPVCEKGKEVFRATDHYVKKHPWISIGAATVTALAISQLFRRR